MGFSRTAPLSLLFCAVGGAFAAPAPQGPAPGKERIVLVGDLTVASDGGWGDGFIRHLAPGVEAVNMGRPGRSSKSYRGEGIWRQVLAMRPTWVFIQFGHNDQPGKGPARETDPKTAYRENLSRYVDEAWAIGARPVLVTSLTRREFDPNGKIKDSLAPYAEAAKAVAAAKGVPVIDLHARSIELMEQIGPRKAAEFDHASKDPRRPDRTHLSPRGEAEIAKIVVGEAVKSAPDLARMLVLDKP